MRQKLAISPQRLAAAVLLVVASSVPLALPAQRPARGSTGEAWQIVPLPQSSLVFARDGSLIGEVGKEWRTSVSISTLPPYVPHAFVAIEDHRFYQHNGVDLIGVAGAIKDDILGDRRGASTITQQLVGNMHPDIIDRSQRSGMDAINRKLREQAAAREMEKHYNKAQILEAYLNTIDLGHNWFGIEAAARHYFGKAASRLTLAEAASLASLPRSPPYYDPIKHPDHNKQRRDLVLSLMAEQGYISKADAAAAKREPVVAASNSGMSAWSPYFVDVVRQRAERSGVAVGNGGYRIYTTLDPALQRAAVDALVSGIAAAEQRPGYNHPTYDQARAARSDDYLQGAVVAMDPFNGEVRALVGGRNYVTGPFNRAVNARRQPGSSIKPIVYAKAIEDSIPASTVVPDTALAIPLPDGRVYRPEDDDGVYRGPMTMHEALVGSRNSVAVQIGLRVGIDSIAALAQRLGIASPIAPYPSSAIGASVVRPIEMVAAYSAFANPGAVVEPRLIVRVEDGAGHTVLTEPPSIPRPAMDPRVAYIVRSMMKDVAERGTGAQARRIVPASVPIAGKTGTTNDNVDVWFVGVTPDLVAGVWMGFDRPQTIMRGAAGGSLAAPVWANMLAAYYASHPAPRDWAPAPPGLVYAELDRDTGELATDQTPADKRYVEYFIPGTEPEPLRRNPWKIPQWGPMVY